MGGGETRQTGLGRLGAPHRRGGIGITQVDNRGGWSPPVRKQPWGIAERGGIVGGKTRGCETKIEVPIEVPKSLLCSDYYRQEEGGARRKEVASVARCIFGGRESRVFMGELKIDLIRQSETFDQISVIIHCPPLLEECSHHGCIPWW